MNVTMLSITYAVLLVGVTVFSWGFVDANMALPKPDFLYNLVLHNRAEATALFVGLQTSLFLWYVILLRLVHQKRIIMKHIIWFTGISMVILFFSFPGFSYDLFNYIATAKVTFFYRENPWLVMPIEIPNEPMLAYLHASNKVALYGPSWILLTGIPHVIGSNNLLLTIFSFKALVAGFYVGLLYLLWKVSKSIFAVAFFGLNPLVSLETLVSGHNDVVMMFLALWALLLLSKNRMFWSLVIFMASIFIKGATIVLIPIYLWVAVRGLRGEKIMWDTVWFWAAISMYIIFLLSPLREEIYVWYLIWPLTFVALMPKWSILHMIALGFSFGLPLRLAPFLYLRNWGGITPLIKKLVTFLPAVLAILMYEVYKKR